MYFDPNTKSPITLLELGLFTVVDRVVKQKIIVCCPTGFWRKGNVDVVCRRYGIKQVPNFPSLVRQVKAQIIKLQMEWHNGGGC